MKSLVEIDKIFTRKSRTAHQTVCKSMQSGQKSGRNRSRLQNFCHREVKERNSLPDDKSLWRVRPYRTCKCQLKRELEKQ